MKRPGSSSNCRARTSAASFTTGRLTAGRASQTGHQGRTAKRYTCVDAMFSAWWTWHRRRPFGCPLQRATNRPGDHSGQTP